MKSDAARSGSFPETPVTVSGRIADGERVARSRGRAARGRTPRPRPRRRPAARRAAARGRCRVGRRGDSPRSTAFSSTRSVPPRAGFRAIATSSRTRVTAAPRRARSPTGASAAAIERAAPSAARRRRRGGRAPRARASGRAMRPRSGRPRERRHRARCMRGSRRSAATRPASPARRGRRRDARGEPGGVGAAARGRQSHAAARSPTTRPSRSSTIRSACAASAGSWVTRMSVRAAAAVEARQQIDDLGAGRGVQVARRLVGEHETRAGSRRPARARPAAARRPTARRGSGPRAARAPLPRGARRACWAGAARARQLERDGDVLERGEGRDEVEGLEHVADLRQAEPREGVLVQRGEVHAVHAHGAGRRPVEPGDQAEERGLAAADGPVIATNWPAGTSSVTPSRMVTAPAALRSRMTRSRTWTIRTSYYTGAHAGASRRRRRA